MFGKQKNAKETEVFAPMNGTSKDIVFVPDEAFSEKMLGDGMAIVPDDGTVFSPVNGTIEDIPDTKHAFCITTDDGCELLLHIGINTVNLKGEGFSVFVSNGDRVRVGDKLARVDLELLKKHNLPLDTPVLMTEREKLHIVTKHTGKIQGGKDVLFTYQKL